MKIVVDKLPSCSGECLFSDYIEITSRRKCMFQRGLYSRCNLDCGEECTYLKEGAKV